jgi:phosphoribosylaminoimidazole carboxylase (NCAIR synthetase)
VVFADDTPWDSFVALSTYLRRSGLRTIRVTTHAGARESPLFDRTILVGVGRDADFDGLADLLAGEHVVDIQSAEFVAEAVYGALIGRVGSEASHRAWRAREVAIDKFVVSSRLRAAGIPVPEFCDSSVAPGEALATCGLPMIVKPRTGAGGWGVSVIASHQELADWFGTRERAPGILERFIEGDDTVYGAVAQQGSIIAEMTYICLGRQFENGPARTVVVTDDPIMKDLGRRVVVELGLDGLVGVGAMRDRDGRYFIHDVNPRLWGSAATGQVAGERMMTAYARALGGTPPRRGWRAPRSFEPHNVVLPVFPSGVRDVIGGSTGLAQRWRLWRWCRPYAAEFGREYVAAELARRRSELGC